MQTIFLLFKLSVNAHVIGLTKDDLPSRPWRVQARGYTVEREKAREWVEKNQSVFVDAWYQEFNMPGALDQS